MLNSVFREVLNAMVALSVNTLQPFDPMTARLSFIYAAKKSITTLSNLNPGIVLDIRQVKDWRPTQLSFI
jgi:hypothetical protein